MNRNLSNLLESRIRTANETMVFADAARLLYEPGAHLFTVSYLAGAAEKVQMFEKASGAVTLLASLIPGYMNQTFAHQEYTSFTGHKHYFDFTPDKVSLEFVIDSRISATNSPAWGRYASFCALG